MKSVSVGSSTSEYDACSGWIYLLFFPPVLGSRLSTRGRTLDWNMSESPALGPPLWISFSQINRSELGSWHVKVLPVLYSLVLIYYILF